MRVTLPSAAQASSAASSPAALVRCAHCGAEAAIEVGRDVDPDVGRDVDHGVVSARGGAVEPARGRPPRGKPATLPPDPALAADDPREISGLLTVERRCPKCRALVGSRAACPGCGLASSRMAGFASARDAEIPEAVRAAWSAVVASPEAWAEQARHDAFVQLVASASAFAWAAGQYQEIRRQRPDDAVAVRQLERVRRTAEAAMLATTTVREVKQSPYRSATAILVMLVVLLIAGAVYARFMREAQDPAHAITPVAPLRPGAQR